MSEPASRNSRRHRRGSLDLAAIAEAALAIIDADGIEALTMRGLAAELGASVNTVYWYARTKDEILAAVRELVMGRVPLPTTGAWDERLIAIIRDIRELLVSHPGVGLLGLNAPSSGPASLRLTDELLGLLRSGGLRGAEALAALRVLVGYVYGFTAQGAAYASDHAQGYRTQIRGAAPEIYPHLVEIGSYLDQDNSAEFFEYGLRLIVGGLHSRGAVDREIG